MSIENQIIIAVVLLILLVFILQKKKIGKHSRNVKKSKKILNKINSFEHSGQKINYLRKIDPYVFEELLLSVFEKQGLRIKRNRRYSGDGGLDGIIYDQNNNKILIQAKRYSSYINVQHLNEFSELVRKQKATKGYFIHTGKSGQNTRNNYQNTNIEIIGGTKLTNLLLGVNPKTIGAGAMIGIASPYINRKNKAQATDL